MSPDETVRYFRWNCVNLNHDTDDHNHDDVDDDDDDDEDHNDDDYNGTVKYFRWNCVNLNHDNVDHNADDDDELLRGYIVFSLGRVHRSHQEKVKPSLQMVGYAAPPKNWISI